MKKYEHRVNRQEFLNCPGFHDGAYVRAYVEDTTNRGLTRYRRETPRNFEPRIVLEIADCSSKCTLEFDMDSGNRRQNSFHKIDTLIDALVEFRAGLAEESTLYKKREAVLREFKKLKEAEAEAKKSDFDRKRDAERTTVDGVTADDFFAARGVPIDPDETY